MTYKHVTVLTINTIKESLTVGCHISQLPQFGDGTTYIAFQCAVSYNKYTLTSRNLLLHSPYAKVFADILVHDFEKGTEYFKKSSIKSKL